MFADKLTKLVVDAIKQARNVFQGQILKDDGGNVSVNVAGFGLVTAKKIGAVSKDCLVVKIDNDWYAVSPQSNPTLPLSHTIIRLRATKPQDKKVKPVLVKLSPYVILEASGNNQEPSYFVFYFTKKKQVNLSFNFSFDFIGKKWINALNNKSSKAVIKVNTGTEEQNFNIYQNQTFENNVTQNTSNTETHFVDIPHKLVWVDTNNTFSVETLDFNFIDHYKIDYVTPSFLQKTFPTYQSITGVTVDRKAHEFLGGITGVLISYYFNADSVLTGQRTETSSLESDGILWEYTYSLGSLTGLDYFDYALYSFPNGNVKTLSENQFKNNLINFTASTNLTVSYTSNLNIENFTYPSFILMSLDGQINNVSRPITAKYAKRTQNDTSSLTRVTVAHQEFFGESLQTYTRTQTNTFNQTSISEHYGRMQVDPLHPGFTHKYFTDERYYDAEEFTSHGTTFPAVVDGIDFAGFGLYYDENYNLPGSTQSRVSSDVLTGNFTFKKYKIGELFLNNEINETFSNINSEPGPGLNQDQQIVETTLKNNKEISLISNFKNSIFYLETTSNVNNVKTTTVTTNGPNNVSTEFHTLINETFTYTYKIYNKITQTTTVVNPDSIAFQRYEYPTDLSPMLSEEVITGSVALTYFDFSTTVSETVVLSSLVEITQILGNLPNVLQNDISQYQLVLDDTPAFMFYKSKVYRGKVTYDFQNQTGTFTDIVLIKNKSCGMSPNSNLLIIETENSLNKIMYNPFWVVDHVSPSGKLYYISAEDFDYFPWNDKNKVRVINTRIHVLQNNQLILKNILKDNIYHVDVEDFDYVPLKSLDSLDFI